MAIVISEPMIDQIVEFVKRCIIDEVKNLFQYNIKYTEVDMYQMIPEPILPIQIYYDEQNRRVYIYYDLDPRAKKEYPDFIKMYLKINSRIINTFYEAFTLHPYILGPANIYKDKRLSSKVYCTDSFLTANTTSYWRTFDERYKFISNENIVNRDRMVFLMNGGTEAQLDEFDKQVLAINQSRDFVNNNDIDVIEGFIEYQELYKQYFGRDLQPIDPSNPHMQYIYLDAYYEYMQEVNPVETSTLLTARSISAVSLMSLSFDDTINDEEEEE